MEQLTVFQQLLSVTTASLEHLNTRGPPALGSASPSGFCSPLVGGVSLVVRLGHPVLPALQRTPPRASPKQRGWEGSSSQCWAEMGRDGGCLTLPCGQWAVTGSFSVGLASGHNDLSSYLASKAPLKLFHHKPKGRAKLEFILWNFPHSGSVICVFFPVSCLSPASLSSPAPLPSVPLGTSPHLGPSSGSIQLNNRFLNACPL